MFKKLLLCVALGLSFNSILPVKIKTVDGRIFELTDEQLNQLQSQLISGIVAEGIVGDFTSLPINQQTFLLLDHMLLKDTDVFNVEHAQSVLGDSTATDFLPMLQLLYILFTTNEDLLRVVTDHYFAIQREISWENFAAQAPYISAFFHQQSMVQKRLSVAVGPYLCLQRFAGHGVKSIAFSPNCQTVLTGADEDTARLWRISDGQCLQIFTGHTNGVYSIAFLSDGQTVVTWSGDKTARLWRVSDGQCLQTFTGHTGPILSVAFSPDGQTVVTWSGDKIAKLWRVSDGVCLKTFTEHTDWIRSAVFSPDGQTVVTGSKDNTAKLWRVSNSQCLKTFIGHAGWVCSVAFSPNGQTIVTGSSDKTARLWRVSDGQCLQILTGHTNGVYSVAFSPDGQTVVTGSDDSIVRWWRVSDGQCLQTFTGHTGPVSSVAFSSDGQTVVTWSCDRTARLWAINLNEPQQLLVVWGMQNPGKFERGDRFLDEVYDSLPEQLKRKITGVASEHCSVM